MADPQHSSILSVVQVNWLIQADNGVSRKYPSKVRRSFLPYLQIKPFGVRCKSGKNLSSQHGNADVHLFRSFLRRVVSTFVFFCKTEV